MKQMKEPSIRIMSFEDMLDRDGFVVFTNVGRSMLPLLRERRDIIEVKKKDTDRCKKYDLVLYKRKDMYIIHRILKVLPKGYIIAGDHNIFIEKDVTDDMILGVVSRIIRNGKTITPDNFWYKAYVHLWCDVYPVRMLILKVKWKIKSFVYRSLRFVKRRAIKLMKN